jgi:type I site-specific restriction endonuclease
LSSISNKITPLNLPEADLKIIREGGTFKIFDFIKKKYLVLTPEEWVRQNLIYFLVNQKNYKPSLTAIEKKFTLNQLSKRFDAVFYNQAQKPVLLLECKAPQITINQEVMHQALTYQKVIDASNILLSNGINHLWVEPNLGSAQWLQYQDFPDFSTLNL